LFQKEEKFKQINYKVLPAELLFQQTPYLLVVKVFGQFN
jgi:hypothetical protein